jgi:hypothetical protein
MNTGDGKIKNIFELYDEPGRHWLLDRLFTRPHQSWDLMWNIMDWGIWKKAVSQWLPDTLECEGFSFEKVTWEDPPVWRIVIRAKQGDTERPKVHIYFKETGDYMMTEFG